MFKRIAILGWGSLLWDLRPEFDQQHHKWMRDGPTLKLEFSRISKSRRGALTLVIDPTNGQPNRVAYALSKRIAPEDALCDLRSREQTVRRNVGYLSLVEPVTESFDDESSTSIHRWAKDKKIDVVVWTKLPSNFEEICGKPFTVREAVAHIQALDAEGKARAAEYVWRTPSFISTPLRRVLESQPWFSVRRHRTRHPTRTRAKRARSRSTHTG